MIRTFGGKYTPLPIEYKRGKPKDHDADILQVAAQAMCLEEMLDCTITQGALYYGEIKHRVNIQITEGIKQNVKDMFDEMHQYYERGYTPKAKKKKACYVCSLKDLCLPELEKTARLRLQYPDIPLGKLAGMSDPPLTKSGLNHRLRKITEIAGAVTDHEKGGN